MQKKIFYSGVLFFLIASSSSRAQTLVSRMGPVQFFNSLDSAKSARLTRIAGRCFCMMQLLDSTRSIQLKLDLAEASDSVFYVLDFNILDGHYVVPDSAGTSMDSQPEKPGIYIKARDSILRPEIILRMLDYGVRHYADLQQQRKSGKMYDRAFIEATLKQKPTPGLKKAMARCK